MLAREARTPYDDALFVIVATVRRRYRATHGPPAAMMWRLTPRLMIFSSPSRAIVGLHYRLVSFAARRANTDAIAAAFDER